MDLKYATRGNSEPGGKPKVYFSCHPDDFDMAFPQIAKDILEHSNCVIWYDADLSSVLDEEELDAVLGEMQLAVFAVTSRFLHEAHRAKDIELPLVLKKHIPVLPITLEKGLGYEFSNTCAKIQIVSRAETDPTAIPYDEVLQTFLDSVLVGDELAEKVRDAFDAYVFLSYRKKDRRHAQRLMRLIHENKQYRDIAIWYDEFLVPGEGFNEAIKDAFQKSSLFAMAVTPHLEEKGNYVMRVEYPMARDRKKESTGFEIVPVEMYEPQDGEEGTDWRIDQSRLAGHEEFSYREIEDLEDEHRPVEMNQAFIDALEKIAKKEHDGSARHKFFIGLAYLNGIDMEVDPELALELLIEAAEDQEPSMEAAAKLADMYLNGEGVERNRSEAIRWQLKLADQYLAAYEKNHDPKEHRGYGTAYFKALRKLSEIYKDGGNARHAVRCLEKALAFCTRLEEEVGVREQQRDKALILNRLGSIYYEYSEYGSARTYFEKAAQIYEKQASEMGTQRVRRDLSISYEKLGDVCRALKDLKGAEVYYRKTEELRRQLLAEAGTAERRRDLSAVLTKRGNVYREQKDYAQAGAYFNEALAMDRVLAEEVRSAQAWDDYGVSLVKTADICKTEGKLQETARRCREACWIFRKNVKKTDALPMMDHLAGGCEKLASAEKKLGHGQAAQSLYREAIEVRRKLYETDGKPSSAHALAVAYYNAGLFLKDKECMREAYDLWNTLCASNPKYAKYRDLAALGM